MKARVVCHKSVKRDIFFNSPLHERIAKCLLKAKHNFKTELIYRHCIRTLQSPRQDIYGEIFELAISTESRLDYSRRWESRIDCGFRWPSRIILYTRCVRDRLLLRETQAPCRSRFRNSRTRNDNSRRRNMSTGRQKSRVSADLCVSQRFRDTRWIPRIRVRVHVPRSHVSVDEENESRGENEPVTRGSELEDCVG
jgi:hypothetical protein